MSKTTVAKDAIHSACNVATELHFKIRGFARILQAGRQDLMEDQDYQGLGMALEEVAKQAEWLDDLMQELEVSVPKEIQLQSAVPLYGEKTNDE